MLNLQNMTIAELEELKKNIDIALSDKCRHALNKLATEHAGETLSTAEIANIMQCKWQAVYSLMLTLNANNEKKYRKRKKVTTHYVNVDNPNDTMSVTRERTYYTIVK